MGRIFLLCLKTKADLAAFISIQLSTATYGDIDVVVAGGFVEEDKAFSTAGSDVSTLAATHEEADTRIILHALQTNLKKGRLCKGYRRDSAVAASLSTLQMW
jgi:hypothetical protein